MNVTFERKRLQNTCVTEIMTRVVTNIDVNDRVSKALLLMIDRFNTLPVVNDSGVCVGIISRADLSDALFQEDEELSRFLESEGAPAALLGQSVETCNDRMVRELMSNEVTCVNFKSTLRDACQLMATKNIHHLPVIDEQRKVIGMISSLDVIRFLAENP